MRFASQAGARHLILVSRCTSVRRVQNFGSHHWCGSTFPPERNIPRQLESTRRAVPSQCSALPSRRHPCCCRISDFCLLGYGRRALPTLRPYPPTLVEAFARRASTIPPHPMVWVTVKIPSKSCSAVNNPRNNPFQTPKFNPNCGPLGERQAASWRAPKNKENRDLWSQKPQKCLARRR